MLRMTNSHAFNPTLKSLQLHLSPQLSPPSPSLPLGISIPPNISRAYLRPFNPALTSLSPFPSLKRARTTARPRAITSTLRLAPPQTAHTRALSIIVAPPIAVVVSIAAAVHAAGAEFADAGAAICAAVAVGRLLAGPAWVDEGEAWI